MKRKKPNFDNYLEDGQKLTIEGKHYVCQAERTNYIMCAECAMWELHKADTCALPEGLHCEGYAKYSVPSVLLKEV